MKFGVGLGDIKIINQEGNDVEIGKMIPTENYNKIMDLISQLQIELSSTVQPEDKELEWFDTKDELIIESTELEDSRIEIECNYESWSVVKSDINKYKHSLSLEVYENNYTSSIVGLTLEQMKLLRDYLNHKIDYIEN